jgi:glutamate N-acetyltransferase/amino-acid N-acetyltransferase
MTDIDVSRDDLQAALKEGVETSFNCISIDKDQSTSDTCVIMSSNKVPLGEGPDALVQFKAAVAEVCEGLAADMVRKGEAL